MEKKTTSDAIEILYNRYFRGNAEALAELERARERLRSGLSRPDDSEVAKQSDTIENPTKPLTR